MGIGKGRMRCCRTLRLKEVLEVSKDVLPWEASERGVRVLDDTGALVAEPGHCREVRFLKDDLLQVRHAGNSVSYVDFTERPVLFCPPACPQIREHRIVTGEPYLLQQDKAGVCQYMRVAFFVHRVDGVLCEDVRWQSAFPMPPHGRWRLLL